MKLILKSTDICGSGFHDTAGYIGTIVPAAQSHSHIRLNVNMKAPGRTAIYAIKEAL